MDDAAGQKRHADEIGPDDRGQRNRGDASELELPGAVGAVLAAGLVYALVRRRMRQLPLWIYLLFLIPIGVDGVTQLVGLRESNWELRTLTGALFGAASIWFAYPYVDDAMQEVLTPSRRA